MKIPSFKRKPKPLTLADQRDQRVRLAAQIAQAENDLVVVRERALEADIDGPNAPELVAIRDHESYLTVLGNKLIRLDAEIAEREAAEAAAADRKIREATSRKLNAFADDLSETGKVFLTAAVHLEHSLVEVRPVVSYGAYGTDFGAFVSMLVREGPEIIDFYIQTLRTRAQDTIAPGSKAPPTLPTPFLPAIVPPEPKGPTMQIFALEHLEWPPAGPGELCRASAFNITALPVEYAEIALARGVAVLPDSERAKAIIGNKHGPSAGVPRTVNLARNPKTVSVYSHNSGRLLREETPGADQPFQNYRAGEPERKVWVSRPEPQPEPGSSDPNSGIFDDPA
ncbi:MAG: hypothetical protein ACLP4V_25485 [Methylocella sp.]